MRMYLCVCSVCMLACYVVFILLLRVVFLSVYFICFVKQKTAYDMRISDWSSDVCSSDLPTPTLPREGGGGQRSESEERRGVMWPARYDLRRSGRTEASDRKSVV